MILDTIVEHKKNEVRESKLRKPVDELKDRIRENTEALDLYQLLSDNEGIKIIAEVKKASPSRGIISRDFDPVRIARSYEKNGAFAVSVLTDERFFGGRLQYLEQIKQSVSLPLLRKDFTIDPYQIYEARAYGADIVLLIASILGTDKLVEFLHTCRDAGVSAIVEVHDERELESAMKAGSRIIGINNRDLRTFSVDTQVSHRLAALIPEGVRTISESGIRSGADIERLRAAGITAFLIGESFMVSDDPGAELKKLLDSVS